MAGNAAHRDHLHQLQSDDQLTLLDEIDKLRSQGISHYVSLPQLIVCGDQSSGKSSSLEAISGISFPTKDNLCTRFATEVILRKANEVTVAVSIVPSQARSEEECKQLLGFRETLDDFKDFPSLVDKANNLMGISAAGNAFSNDVLRVEVSGPDRPHLTIVDLPGMIHSENKVQTAADVALVLGMVRQYMENKRSIILAVISAKNDYANQIVLKLAKEVDPAGGRTLGIITKPDTLPVGSESEAGFIGLAMNEDVNFRLGWHILRNRDYGSRNSTTEARDDAETMFFSQGVWKDLPRQAVGIATLRERLSKVLLDQIKAELPSLVNDIQKGVDDCQDKLNKLGGSRTTLDEQRLFLLRISQSFQSLCKAAVDGTYGDVFFGDAHSAEGYKKRLRAIVQNHNIHYAEDMRLKGHHREIVDAEAVYDGRKITRQQFLDEISWLLTKSRGKELPGMFNPLIVGDLFYEQSKPWEKMTRGHLHVTWTIVKGFLELALAYLTDENTAGNLFKEVIDPILNQKWQIINDKLQELLAQNQKGHPITYNHYFTEAIQKVRQERTEKEVMSRLQSVLGTHAERPIQQTDTLTNLGVGHFRVSTLLSALAPKTEANMDRFACQEILVCMEAYYKVALKLFVDNVTTQAVEACLIRGLESILSPSSILEMSPEMVTRIADEPQEHQQQRDHLTRKLAVLNSGLETCKRYTPRDITSSGKRPMCQDDIWSTADVKVDLSSDPPSEIGKHEIPKHQNGSPTEAVNLGKTPQAAPVSFGHTNSRSSLLATESLSASEAASVAEAEPTPEFESPFSAQFNFGKPAGTASDQDWGFNPATSAKKGKKKGFGGGWA